MNRVLRALVLGLATAAAGVALSAIPSIAALEDSIGLRSLFRMRGPLAPPSGVAIVSIDEAAAARLNLPERPRDWPRSTHAVLVDRLTERGVSVIAFDFEFFTHSASPAEDQAFAGAMARSGRVALVQRLDRLRTANGEMWVLQDPVPLLANAAAVVAPAVVPDAPLVGGVWTFIDTPRGELPSLAAAAFQLHLHDSLDDLSNRLVAAGAGDWRAPSDTAAADASGQRLAETMQAVRRAARGNREPMARLVGHLESEAEDQAANQAQRAALALGRLYAGPASSYLNFYGPPGTICTVPYEVVMSRSEDGSCALRGAVVFVGVGKGRIDRADQDDLHRTVYGGESGDPLSGVEIHATALSNLLDASQLRVMPPSSTAALLFVAGLVLGATASVMRTRRRRARGAAAGRVQAAAVLTAMTIAYGVLVYLAFARAHVVMPLVVPVAFQFPLALIAGLLSRPIRLREDVRGICLVTDAAGSTALGQRLAAPEYATLMSRYTEALMKPVLRHRGDVLAPQGDGFVCLWSESQRAGIDGHPAMSRRLDACLAALEITQASAGFNAALPAEHRLPTRIGMTVGAFTVYSDSDRGVYEAFGDALNVAARLRDLNVELGTSVLASEDVVKGLDRVLRTRALPDVFTLKGVATAPRVVEITGTHSDPLPPAGSVNAS